MESLFGILPLTVPIILSLYSFSRKSVFLIGFFVMLIAVISSAYVTWNSWALNESANFSFTWLHLSNSLKLEFGFYGDRYGSLLALLTTVLTFIIHIYAYHYLHDEVRYRRFTGLFLAFCGTMVGLVYSFNLIQLFIFWELVGLCSYFLIGFWHEKSGSSESATQAFLLNRFGDVFLLAGILWVGIELKDFNLYHLIEKGQFSFGVILMFLGAMTKSAQFPFHIWLPNAMVGPTPVSALLHSATMVASGVFLMLRIFPLANQNTLLFILIIGTLSAFCGAFLASREHELKRIWAYSSISQLGLMMMAIGFGYPEIAFFHLITHAFFKCALFLCSGIILHYLANHSQINTTTFSSDIRLMGGLKKNLPHTFALTLIAGFALAGLPFSSGFLSKEGIVSAGLQWALEYPHSRQLMLIFPFSVLMISSATGYYVCRTLILVFMGKYRNALHYNQTNGSSKHSVEPFKENKHTQLLIPILIITSGCFWILFSPIHPFDVEHAWITTYLRPNISFAFSDVAVVSTLFLLTLGIVIAYATHRDYQLPETLKFAHHKIEKYLILPFSSFIKGIEHFLSDALINQLVVRRFLPFVDYLHCTIELKFIDPLVIGIAKIIGHNEIGGQDFSLASLVRFVDEKIVDGIVLFTAKTSFWGSKLFQNLQMGRVQTYFIITLMILSFIYALSIIF